MQRADEAAALRGILSPVLDSAILGTLNSLVAHYRGASLNHDVMVGKIGEISALMGLVDHLDGQLRAGEAAREREFSDGATQVNGPGSRSRPKST